MILQDVLRDTAEELESLEDEDNVRSEAVTMHHNPTLENMYQRLEQMEVYVIIPYEPVLEKTNNLGFQPGLTQIS